MRAAGRDPRPRPRRSARAGGPPGARRTAATRCAVDRGERPALDAGRRRDPAALGARSYASRDRRTGPRRAPRGRLARDRPRRLAPPLTRERRIGAACVAGAAALWGLWPLWVRRGPGGATTATIALLVAGVVGAPLALRQGRSARARGLVPWLLLGALGLTGAANVWCYFRALAEGAVAPAVLSHYLAPVLVAVFAPLLLGEPRSRRTPVALALALGGTAAMVLIGSGSPAAGGPLQKALVLGSSSALFYAANVLLAKRLARAFSDGELLAYHALVAAAALALVTGLPARATDWIWPTIGGLVSTLGAGLLYFAGIRRLPAEQAGVLTYLEPVAALGVGWVAFGEAPTAAAALGGALILAGGLLVVTAPG
ncbi:MAG: DMT family transporter [Myxococcales bacterium]|nr:DMT family transporter [Myxococcales bacterium]